MPLNEPPLNVQELIHHSMPHGGMHWMGLLALGAGGVAMAAVLVGGQQGGMFELALSAVLVVLIGGMLAYGMVTASALRRERARIQAIDELVQLRQWDSAALGLRALMSRPMRSMVGRIQSLIFLVSVLGQRGRYADAISVQEYILNNVRMDEGTTFGLKLGRAMAMLHDERLFDADRAINDLRRSAPGGERGAESGGLTLVEIYRDVKTGHPQEAIDILHKRREPVRDQLGHRAADVFALAARAYDLLGNETEARLWYARATLLAPAKELNRYPEVRILAKKYPATVAPAGAP
jgi:hypothetical protein